MKALVQRVSEARVTVDGDVVGEIGRGVLIFLAVERGDGPAEVEKMALKCARLRIFPDQEGRMNLDVGQVAGAVLVVSQFTLAAEMKKGYRPSFANAEAPARAETLYEAFCAGIAAEGVPVARGRFAADMQVSLINDGPVTIWLDLPSAG